MPVSDQFYGSRFHNRVTGSDYSLWQEITIGWEFSLLPIGAYEPRWFMYRMHMNPDEAVRAHLDLHSQNSVGIHFGLIDNAGESYDAPVHDLIAARRAHGVPETDFVAPHYGQAFRYEAEGDFIAGPLWRHSRGR